MTLSLNLTVLFSLSVKMPICPTVPSAVTKRHNQSNTRRKVSFHLTDFSLSSREVRAETPGRNLESDAEAMEQSLLNCLLMVLLTLLS